MKKSILIGALAVLMLVAFTACNQQMPTYKIPVGMTAEASKTEYLEGEYVDPSTITATVKFSDNSTQTINGTSLGIAAEKMGATVKPITVFYGVTTDANDKENGGVSATVNLTGYAVTSAAVSNLPTSAASDGTIDTEGVSVTVSYGNGKTRTLTSGEFTFSASVASPAGSKNVDVETYELNVFGVKVTALTGLDQWKVNVASSEDPAYDEDHPAYTELVITGPEGFTPISVKSTDTVSSPIAIPASYIGDEYKFNFYLVSNNDGVLGKKQAGSNDYFFVDEVAPANGIAKMAAKGESKETYAATYKVIFGADVSKTFTINVSWGTDYAVKVTSIIPSTTSAPSNKVGETNLASNFDYKLEMASGSTVTVTGGVSSEGYCTIKLLDPTVKGAAYNPRFEIAYGKKDSTGAFVDPAEIKYLDTPITTTTK